MGARSYLIKRWNQAVCQVTNISQERQKTSNIRIEDLLSCLIEFTKLSNTETRKPHLSPFIKMLEEMQIDPAKYPHESSLWEHMIGYSHKRIVFSYAEFSTEKEVSVEQGFHILLLFFEGLRPLVEAHFSPDPKEQGILSVHEIVLLWGYEFQQNGMKLYFA